MEQCEISPEENDEISFEGTILSGCGEPHNRGVYLISLGNSLGMVKKIKYNSIQFNIKTYHKYNRTCGKNLSVNEIEEH